MSKFSQVLQLLLESVPDVDAEKQSNDNAMFYNKNQELIAKIGNQLGDWWENYLGDQILYPNQKYHQISNILDLSVGIENLIKLPLPKNKDEQRIYDIIRKATGTHMNDPVGLRAIQSYSQFEKAKNLAIQMNEKITTEDKRTLRRKAAEKYGLIFLAKKFK